MAKAKMNQPRDIAWYLDKYVEEYPFSVVVEGVTGCNLPVRVYVPCNLRKVIDLYSSFFRRWILLIFERP